MARRTKRLTNGEFVEVVLAARDRVASSWARGAQGRRPPDPNAPKGTAAAWGSSVNPRSDEAVAWCMVGALKAEAPQGWTTGRRIRNVALQAFNEAGILGGYHIKGAGFIHHHIELFNDSHDQAAAVEAFDELARWLKDTGWEPPVEASS